MPELWTNWAGQQHCAPEVVEKPADEQQLIEAVVGAASRGLTVRVAGSGHSFTDAVCTDGCLIDLSGMGRVLDVDPEQRLVTIEAGIVIHDLAEELATHGLALENQGDIDVQSLAGAISTATHGTGERFGNLGSRVESVRVITAAGQALDLDAASDHDGLLAARASVGALGVISRITIQTVPAFTIHRIDEPKPLAEALGRLDELVARNDHFELFAFPHADQCLTYSSRRTDEPPEPRSRWRAYVDDELVTNKGLGLLMRAGRARPSATPAIGRLLGRLVSRSEHKDASHRVYAHERKVRFTEMEYAIPREHAREALERVLQMIRRRQVQVAFPIELRFAAPDDALLSTANGRDTAYIAVHQLIGMEFESYFRGVEAIMDEYDGRPHWGKRHYQSAATLAPRYPGWERFQAVRKRLDPDGVFSNDYVDRVLGPTT